MCALTTNGMLIIDEIETEMGSYHDVLGGGGVYAMLGASICSTDENTRQAFHWIVDRGNDFPHQITDTIQSWNTGCVFRDDLSRKTTRGHNIYGANDFRSFRYLAPKKTIEVADWLECFGAKSLADIKNFHLLCSAERAKNIIHELECRIKFEVKDMTELTFVWEPLPDVCTPSNLTFIQEVLAVQCQFIFSPNAEEGARMLGAPQPLGLDSCRAVLLKLVPLVKLGDIVVLRCGRHGSLAVIRENEPTETLIMHYPAYHGDTPELVKDPTGGGNTFLGAFAFAYAMSKNVCFASICSNVAAACSIEQIGVPSHSENLWNGKSFEERLRHYLSAYEISEDPEKILQALTRDK